MAYSILIVSSSQEQAALISEACQRAKAAAILCCPSYEAAFGPLFMKRWDIIIIDMGMRDGMSILKKIKLLVHHDQSRILAFVKDSISEALFTEALEEGATHLLTANDLRQHELPHLTQYFEPKAVV
ncbi:response regulator [bacterium]|nr:response regulator [bacterium]